MPLYRYDSDASTIYKNRTIHPGQELDLEGDDERILCAEHNLTELEGREQGPISFKGSEPEATEADEDGDGVDLKALAKAILDGDDYDDMRAFVNENLRGDGDDYIQGRDKVTAKLTEFIEG